jgi:hypothetical protein
VSVALGIQHAMRMRHIVISDMPGSTEIFHILSQKARFSKKKKLLNTKCVLLFSTTFSEAFLIQRRIERDMIKNLYRSSCKLPVILVRFE